MRVHLPLFMCIEQLYIFPYFNLVYGRWKRTRTSERLIETIVFKTRKIRQIRAWNQKQKYNIFRKEERANLRGREREKGIWKTDEKDHVERGKKATTNKRVLNLVFRLLIWTVSDVSRCFSLLISNILGQKLW